MISQFLRKYQYLLTTLFFVSVIGFLDNNSVYNLILYKEEINRLQEQVQYYDNCYQRDTRTLLSLKRNPRNIEDVARENYFMSRPGEDVYIFRTQ